MKAPRCARLWEVEAARDGRLDAAALAASQRHALRCAECARERDWLEGLTRGLRAGAPSQDEVALRRTRQATLERAAALAHSRAEEGLGARWALLALAAGTAIAIVVTAVALLWSQERAQHAALVVATPGIGAKWSRHSAGNLERIDLNDGALSVRVRRSPHDPRVVVRVPEGEIEDLGTVFKVTVRRGRTVELSVSQGVVVFRRPGQGDLRLSAGTLWTPVEEPRSAATPMAGAPPKVASAVPPPEPLRSGRARARAGKKPLAAGRAEPDEPAETRPAAEDATAEDGAYLQILALLREGRTDEARLAAVAYLKRFPTGFRRIEVERIADGAR
jgi:hypothetical protein